MALAQCAHQPRGASVIRRGKQQVEVVSHQYIGVDSAFEARRVLAQPFQECQAVPLVKKALRLSAAAPHHVQGNSGRMAIERQGHHQGTGQPVPPLTWAVDLRNDGYGLVRTPGLVMGLGISIPCARAF